MTKIETSTRFTFTFNDNRAVLSVMDALIARGISPAKVASRIEATIGAGCTPETQKVSKSSRAVVVAWTPKKEDGGKTSVKLAGARFELGDSPEARLVEICSKLEFLAAMFCRVESIRLPEAILRHFEANGCCFETKEQAQEATTAYKAVREAMNA